MAIWGMAQVKHDSASLQRVAAESDLSVQKHDELIKTLTEQLRLVDKRREYEKKRAGVLWNAAATLSDLEETYSEVS